MDDKFKQLLTQLMGKVGEVLIADENAEKRSRFKVLTDKYSSENKATLTPLNSRLTIPYNFEKLKNTSGIIQFSKQEISQMPKNFKKVFLLKGLVVSCRRKGIAPNGSFELRYRADGYNVSASGRTLEIAKFRFIEKIKIAERQDQTDVTSGYPTIFIDFAKFFFEHYQRKKICEKQQKVQKARIDGEFSRVFKKLKLKEITPLFIQNYIDGIIAEEKFKKAEDVKSQLNKIFDYANKLSIIKVNPVSLIVFTKHEREHGKALSKDEEKRLLTALNGSKYQVQFAVALYTGLRPNEWKTAKIENGFIVAQNSKRHNGKIEFKKIPITPMLAPYVQGLTKLNFCTYNHIKAQFKKVLPTHKLYDMRTTFFNRCIECEIIESVRDKWMGHCSNNIKQAYTDISDELHIRESLKFDYTL